MPADPKLTPAWQDAGIPTVKSEPKPVWSFRLDREVVERLDTYARNTAQSRSKACERAIVRYLEMYGPRKPDDR